MTLPNDVDRCPGVGFEEDDGWWWREGCEDCLRRTAPCGGPTGEGIPMEPPPIIAFECEYRIIPQDPPQ